MSKPILSICIPTYNRASYLENTLNSFIQEKVFLETDDVEIIISDNCSSDNTEGVCKKFAEKFPDKIRYYKQKENIKDKNFVAVLNMAKGEFAKLNHDNVFFCKEELNKFIDFLKEDKIDDIILLSNGSNRLSGIHKCRDFNEVLDKISYNITWIGAYCFRISTFKKLEDADRYANINGEVEVGKADGLHEANLLQLNIEKADKELGVKPVYSAEEAITKTTEWYKAFYENNTDMIEYTKKQIEEFVASARTKNIDWSL